MNESEMGNRGSKSNVFIEPFVKEQRVDGSYFCSISNTEQKLRYTLVALERGYPIKILSKQLNKKIVNFKIDP